MATDNLVATFERPMAAAPWLAYTRVVSSFMRRKPLGAIGAVLLLVLLIMAVGAPAIAPYHYDRQIFADAMQGPSAKHIFGTDNLGRDLFSRIVYGARVSIIVGFGAVTIAICLSTILGALSGYFGGIFDTVLQRFIEIWQAFPGLILVMTLISITGAGRSQLIVVLGLLFTANASRVIRGSVLGITNSVYFEAARTIGAGNTRILLRYVLPNIAATIIVLATVQLGAIILVEASLSFLGLGIPPPYPSWGQMISGVARNYIVENPWMGLWPGLFISLAVFGFNMLGDALRDVLDPRLRGR
jgi:peptide/nickel transport system permease protein